MIAVVILQCEKVNVLGIGNSEIISAFILFAHLKLFGQNSSVFHVDLIYFFFAEKSNSLNFAFS